MLLAKLYGNFRCSTLQLEFEGVSKIRVVMGLIFW